MVTVNSVSGGKTSAYLEAHYPADYAVFALVRIEDKDCAPKDKGLIRAVQDRINVEFIATAEDNDTLRAVLDLEQFTGRRIHWVTGETFDSVVLTKGGWLPNKLHRYCTSFLKIEPIFQWWRETIGDIVEMRIGYRGHEGRRVAKMREQLNEAGHLCHKAIIGKSKNGRRNRWGNIPWQVPCFPLFDDFILKDDIELFWEDNPVRFAKYNNCVGCFHRSGNFLRRMYEDHPEKIEWFAKQEDKKEAMGIKGFWKGDIRYGDIKDMPLQLELFGHSLKCNGHCGL